MDYFAVIRNTKMSSIISEFGYIDNITDMQKFNTEDKLKREAKALAKAICRFYNVQFKDNIVQEEAKKVEQLFEHNGKQYSWNRETGEYGMEGFMLTPTNFIITYNGHIKISMNPRDMYFGSKQKVKKEEN